MRQENFQVFLKHFVKHSKASTDHPMPLAKWSPISATAEHLYFFLSCFPLDVRKGRRVPVILTERMTQWLRELTGAGITTHPTVICVALASPDGH